ncbi:MAG: amidohydrolase [Candidatus Krumholzibacteriota bacterium]|nr:amidohydrolase [Candidatus Krumholzibacteriota bacterium]
MNPAAIVALLFAVSAAACGVAHGGETTVNTVFSNAVIHTLDEDRPPAAAIAFGDGRIIAVGSTDEVLAAAGPGARTVDLGGATVIPGLVDAHAHFLGYAKSRAWIDLVGTGSPEDVVGLVAGRAAFGSGWIAGRGWDQNDWDDPVYPGRGDLDAVAPDWPVYLSRVCGHAAWVNGAALAAAGVTAETPDPTGGKILRDAGGEPTGILLDTAMELVSSIMPPPTRNEERALLRDAARRCLAAGLTGVHEMGVSAATIKLYREMYDAGELPIRLTLYVDCEEPGLDSILAAGPLRGHAGGMLDVVGVKFFADGSLGARSAALLEDYHDDPGNRGILVVDLDTLADRLAACHRHGFQAAVHAIGDRANRVVLDAIERISGESPAPDRRHRIEHAQVVSEADILRFAALGVVPSMQFTHCTSDMSWAPDRLGADRLAGAYAWRRLLDAGCRIPGGSDFPVESIDPLLGIHAAVTRAGVDGEPAGGWFPDQRLDAGEAVRSFTADAAWAAHQEGNRGVLAAGMFADLTVLSADVMTVDPATIPEIEVLMTVVGGRIAYSRKGFSAIP